MTPREDKADWSLATWDGARREQLRPALTLSVRERLEGLDDLAEINEHLQRLRATGKLRYTGAPPEK